MHDSLLFHFEKDVLSPLVLHHLVDPVCQPALCLHTYHLACFVILQLHMPTFDDGDKAWLHNIERVDYRDLITQWAYLKR